MSNIEHIRARLGGIQGYDAALKHAAFQGMASGANRRRAMKDHVVPRTKIARWMSESLRFGRIAETMCVQTLRVW